MPITRFGIQIISSESVDMYCVIKHPPITRKSDGKIFTSYKWKNDIYKKRTCYWSLEEIDLAEKNVGEYSYEIFIENRLITKINFRVYIPDN